MAPLISRLRRLIGDADDPGNEEWHDDTLQEALDRHRSKFFEQELTPVLPYPPFVQYEAGFADWEEAVLKSGSTTLSPSEIDLAGGRWHFAADTPPPVTVTGWAYDLYAAAIEVLGWWMAKVKGEPEQWTADNVSITRRRVANMDTLVKRYEGMTTEVGGVTGRLRKARLTRSDIGSW